ncbi:MAG TPA: acyl-CoA dehydrogenase family protein, partial [Verrucomicrobiota bacterium]|nr:acyl-CoA dehydrogenase family protein [Verrucomicrobiota bacterium]
MDEDLPPLPAELMHQPRELHVVAAVLGDLRQPAFAEPPDRLQAVGRLLRAEGGRGHGVERRPEAEAFRQKIQAFLGENLPANWKGVGAVPEAEREEWVAQWRKRLVDANLIAPAWPVEYGGAGLSAIERVGL